MTNNNFIELRTTTGELHCYEVGGYHYGSFGLCKLSVEDAKKLNDVFKEHFKDAKPLDPELSKIISDNIMDLF